MKKIYIIGLILISYKGSMCQDYFPLLGNSNVWHVVNCHEGCFTEPYATKGDTLINGKLYKVLGYLELGNVFGFLREDTVNRKVYAIPNSFKDTSEIIFYDFSLEESDSIFLYSLNYDTLGWYSVDSVRFVNIISGSRKAIYLKRLSHEIYGFQQLVWIESIGSTGNPVYRGFSLDAFNTGELNCFFKDSIKIYQSEFSLEFGGCNISIDGIENSIVTEKIVISPNPTNHNITIHIPNYDKFTLIIYNLFGKQLMQLDSPKTIDLYDFYEGTYILKFQIDKNIVIKKLIILK